MSENGKKKRGLRLPPRDLTYRVLMERSAQIKSRDSDRRQEIADKTRQIADTEDK